MQIMDLLGALDIKWMKTHKNPCGNVSLCVAIKQATGTLMSFQLDFPHGTRKLAGAHNCTCVIAFSEHIFKTYKKGMGAGGSTIESGPGL